ncbi:MULTISPECIES: outer membrane beta-barrel protein [Sulfurimonas]|uniref:outer membrane beta-barrel protein n=1 Tax=Sulfurimonas TaxID=202746 RepID=UPI0012645539|nr:outer membrane beta-barrel protein [Sulfurimonas indica]
MKNRLTKAALALTLLSIPALSMADEYNSLFGIEGGYSNINVETAGAGSVKIQKNGFGNVGLKLGAESENFRIFLSARYYDAKDFNKLNTIGGEFQYKFNFTKRANFFLGANAGKAYMKVATNGTQPSVDTSTGYLGADAGFNIHATELIDLEVGARYMSLDKKVTQGAYTYDFSSLTTAYASIILKWQMD